MEIILYAIIAIAIAWRLYTVLGEKHGSERDRPNPFAEPRANAGRRADEDNDVLAFPLARRPEQDEAPPNPLALDAAPAPDSLAGALHAIRGADPAFDEKSFLKGARVAFEMIVHAFASGERGSLRNLVSSRLYDAFAGAIAAREAVGETHDLRLLSVREADIIAARLEGSAAVISVQFVSDQRRAVKDRDGNVKDSGAERMTDIWVFRRDTQSRDPNWMLVETRSV